LFSRTQLLHKLSLILSHVVTYLGNFTSCWFTFKGLLTVPAGQKLRGQLHWAFWVAFFSDINVNVRCNEVFFVDVLFPCCTYRNPFNHRWARIVGWLRPYSTLFADQMKSMLGALRKCTRILGPWKASENALENN
jgi:hypothetical protein